MGNRTAGTAPAREKRPSSTNGVRVPQTDWQAALRGDYRMRGRELVGPCPGCGGVDRFRVMPDGRAFCRHCCPDGSRESVDGLRRIEAAVFGDGADAPRACSKPGFNGGAAHRMQQAAGRRAAGTLWLAGQAADGTPAETYLVDRLAWPPPASPEWQPLPESVRWCAAADWPEDRAVCRLPALAAGAVLYRFADAAGAGRAVQCEALTEDGKRLADRWRRCFGSKCGAWFVAGTVGGDPVAIVEGEASALGAAWLVSGCEARAVGGTAGLAAGHALPSDGRQCLARPAGDLPGDEAVRALHAKAPGIGVRWSPSGQDPADILAKQVRTAAAMCGGPQHEALPAAWGDVIEEAAMT